MTANNPYDSDIVKQNLGNLLNDKLKTTFNEKSEQKSLTQIRTDFLSLVQRLKKSIEEQHELLSKLDGEINPPSNPTEQIKKSETSTGMLGDIYECYVEISNLVKEQENLATRLSKIIG